MNKYTGCTQKASVSVTTSVTQLFDNRPTPYGRASLTIPLHNLSGYLYVLVTPAHGKKYDGTTALDATYVQNYGTRWESTDKVATINVGDEVDVYAVTSTGTFTAYPSEWF